MKQAMRARWNTRAGAEQGFTLIELLVVILIIGILAAIAIPSFLSQKTKATDASAKELARSGAQAAETYATDHDGHYEGLSKTALKEYENAIQIAPGSNNAYINVAESAESGAGFVITAVAAGEGDTFTWTRRANGEVTRTCSAVGTNKNGCPTGDW